MSDFIATSQDAVRDACIATYVHTRNVMHQIAERAKENPGQTAAEYMGVLLLIAVIIAAIVGSGMGGEVAKALKGKVTDISNTPKPDCTKGAC
jgi:Flp pilus assembly pilin Flp